METDTTVATAAASEPDLQTALYEFNVAVIEIYKDLLCEGERIASRHLFRGACIFSEAVAGVLRAEAEEWRTAGAMEARRRIQECLYWLWLLDERGYLGGNDYRDQAFGRAFYLHEGLTDLIAGHGTA
ncbi:MAG: hypothetical protein ACOCYC_03625 [bacterium]